MNTLIKYIALLNEKVYFYKIFIIFRAIHIHLLFKNITVSCDFYHIRASLLNF